LFPKLRFKKFNGDWEKTTIGAKSEIVTSGSRDWAQYYSDSGDKFIRMTNLVRNGINLDLSDLRFVQLPVGSNEGKRTSLEKGDILISITAELGKLGWIPEGLGTAYINQHTALVRMKNTLDSKFVAYALSTEKYNNKLNSLNDSGAKAGLNLGSIRSFELTIPSKPEQTQIASFLSVVDEKISQLTQKLELLSQYKQGMMQKLFSQQIRFKADDGSEFGEWEEKIIGEIANIKRGASPRPITDTKWFDEDSKVGWVRISDVSKSKKVLVETEQYLSIAGIKKSRFIPKGNIIMSICATIGKPIYTGFDVCIHDGFVVFSELKAWHEYTYYYLEYIEKNWYQYGQPGTQVNLNSDIVSNEIFPFPCLEEQTKIANFLSAIDQKIEVVAQQIEQAKQWNKGLLQQMFI
jgi:type I restriction enzyme S subunit